MVFFYRKKRFMVVKNHYPIAFCVVNQYLE